MGKQKPGVKAIGGDSGPPPQSADTFGSLYDRARNHPSTFDLRTDLAIGAALAAEDMAALEKVDLGIESVHALRAIVGEGWNAVDDEKLSSDERRELFAKTLKCIEAVMHSVSSRASHKESLLDILRVRAQTMGAHTRHMAERGKVTNPDLLPDFLNFQIDRFLLLAGNRKTLKTAEVADLIADTYTQFAREYCGGTAAGAISQG